MKYRGTDTGIAVFRVTADYCHVSCHSNRPRIRRRVNLGAAGSDPALKSRKENGRDVSSNNDAVDTGTTVIPRRRLTKIYSRIHSMCCMILLPLDRLPASVLPAWWQHIHIDRIAIGYCYSVNMRLSSRRCKNFFSRIVWLVPCGGHWGGLSNKLIISLIIFFLTVQDKHQSYSLIMTSWLYFIFIYYENRTRSTKKRKKKVCDEYFILTNRTHARCKACNTFDSLQITVTNSRI